MKKKMIICLFILTILLVGCGKKETKTETEKNNIEIKEASIEYGCNVGDALNNNNICVHQISTIAAFRYACPAGYHSVGNMCWKNGGVLNLSKCGANHVEVNGHCYNNFIGTMEYYCAYGKLQGTSCISETTYNPTTKYHCEDGYTLTNDNKCQKG